MHFCFKVQLLVATAYSFDLVEDWFGGNSLAIPSNASAKVQQLPSPRMNRYKE